MKSKVFEPYKFGPFNLKNRIVLASMTRTRAQPDGIVTPLVAEYYRQRAESAGLVLTECVPVNMKHNSFVGAGGMATIEQAESWKQVIEKVHKENSVIFTQIWHPGRAHHSKATGTRGIAPSPIAIEGKARVGAEHLDHEVPLEMEQKDIDQAVKDFQHGAEMAKLAGFDGIEIHGANGYLVDQFLRTSSNHRKDNYGGSIENRARFCLEVIDAVSKVFPPERVGIKFSLVGRYQSMRDDDPVALGIYLSQELSKRNILYVQFGDADNALPGDPKDLGENQIANVAKTFRPHFKGQIITNGAKDWKESVRRVEDGEADLVSFAKLFLSNPDLTERMKNGWEFTQPDMTVYTGKGEVGYSDWPKYQEKKN